MIIPILIRGGTLRDTENVTITLIVSSFVSSVFLTLFIISGVQYLYFKNQSMFMTLCFIITGFFSEISISVCLTMLIIKLVGEKE